MWVAVSLFKVYNIGFRKSLAITTIAIFSMWLSSSGKQRLVLKNWRVCILGISLALLFFVYKLLYILIKLGDWQAVLQRIKDPNFYLLTIDRSEPFITQVILNEPMSTCRLLQEQPTNSLSLPINSQLSQVSTSGL